MRKLLNYNSTLVERVDLEPSLAVFTVRPDKMPVRSPGPLFLPGQYVTIGLNRDDLDGDGDNRPVSVRRAMSIASSPETDDVYELYIRYVSEPESSVPLTHLMWPLQVGQRLFCRPAAVGKFTLADTIGADDARLKVMVAAGTGLAPFLSMARSRVQQDPSTCLDDFAILHGASYASSLGYRAELEALAGAHGLRYLPTLSRPDEAPEWTGCGGRVEALLSAERLEKTQARLDIAGVDFTPDNVAVYICGLQGTIANTVIHLLARGFVPDNRRIRRALAIDETMPASVFWEQYDTTPVLDLKDLTLVEELRGIAAAAGVGVG
jgi:ferredoxin--NADP+ reductase